MNANRYPYKFYVDVDGTKRPASREDNPAGEESRVLGKHYDQHLIVMQQDMADVGVMGAYLQNAHLRNTALWQWGDGGVFRRIAGIELEPGAVTKLTLLGHGNPWFRTLGGRDGFELGAQVSVIQSDHGLVIPKVYAFGCYADCDINGSTLVRDLRTALHGYGIDAEVKGPPGPIIATPDGRKVQLDAPVPGSMGVDTPLSLSSMQRIGHKTQGHARGAIFRDASEQTWYVKGAGGDEDFARNEVLAGELLRMAGVHVPDVRTIDLDDAFGGGIGVASKAVEGARPVDWRNDDAARRAARKDFAAQAFVGNRDAIGMSGDNYVVGKDGVHVSVDHGGALRYQAKGEPKGSEFGKRVQEIDALRDPSKVSAVTTDVYRQLTFNEIRDGMERVVAIGDDAISETVELHGPRGAKDRAELVETLLARKGHYEAALKAMRTASPAIVASAPKPDPMSPPVPVSMAPGVAEDVRFQIANLHRLQQKDFLKPDGTSNGPLSFRGVAESPDDIFPGGFQPRARGAAAHASLRKHQLNEDSGMSNLVSVSRVPDIAAKFAVHRQAEAWVYVMHGLKSLDINQRLGRHTEFSDEHEGVVPDGIPRETIVGAYRVNEKGIVPGTFRPSPYFEATGDASRHGARRDLLVAKHHDALRARDVVAARGDEDILRRVDAHVQRVEGAIGELMRDMDADAVVDAYRREWKDTTLVEDPYARHVVIAEEADEDVMHAANKLRLNHFDKAIMVVPQGSTLRTRAGDNDERTGGDMKVEAAGHHRDDGTVGHRTPQELAQQVANAERQYGGKVKEVEIVSCNTDDCAKSQLRDVLAKLREDLGGKSALVDALESTLRDVAVTTTDDVAKALLAHGIDAKVVGHEGGVLVDREGRKHAVPEGTQGALGVDPDGLRLQIIMEDDAMMGMYAAYRQLRHPDNSLLVRPSAGNGLWSGVFKTGVPAYLELFGHGDPIRRLMGGYDGKTVAGYAATLRDRMNLEVLKVKAITCMGTLCDENGRSFVGDLTEGLREHGIDAPVSGYDKRITVTKEGRVEPWGSAPRISFPPAPMRPKIERRPARPPIEAPKNPDKYVRRVIGTVGRSADSYEAGLALYNKYGKRSVLMEKHQGSWMPTRSSDGSRIDGDVKVQLVGEGRNGKLGNRDAQDLARDVAAFHAIYGGKIAKVGLVSCNSNDCDATGKSLVDKVSTELHALGIDTNVVGRNGAVQVDRRGHKHAVPVGTPGSLGDGKAETSDGIEVKLDAPMPGSNKDKHDVIVIEEDDAFVGLMAGFRLQKHPLTSGLVLARGNKLTAVTGVFERGAEADVDLFGHGELRDGKRLLGGRDAKSLASQVMDLRDRLDLKIRKVHLFSCKSADCDETGRSMVDDMSEELLAQGITAPVKGHHGAIELTPDGRTIKAPTRAERSERTGGWDKFELPTPAAPTPVSTPPVVAEPVVEKYVRRVIGIGDGSTETYAAAMALYDKYPTHSVVLKRFRDSWLPTRTSNGNQTEGDVKVQLVGEGKDGKLGNRDAQDLARDVANFHARYGGKIAKVGLVSCNSNDCDATGKSLVDKVSTELHALGIDTNVVGRNGAVQVDRRGHKHAVPQGTPGSLGNVKVDLSSGALPESLAPSLTPHERALLGNLHAIDDSYFLGDDEEPLTRFLFRGDARYPAEIFLRGFAAWKRGPDVPVDLDEHQRGETKTNLVSLSKVPSVATGFANYMGLVTGRHVFVTWGQRGLDVNKRLPFSWQPDQYEVAVPDAVAPEMILGAYNVTSKGIVAGSFQPNPRFEARMDREGFAARQRSLLDRHASISSALDELKRKWPWKRKAVAKARLQLDRAKVEQELQGLYREQEAAARRDANRRDFLDTTLRE